MSRVKLSAIRTLTFYADEWTTARRADPLPQLVCEGAPCDLFTPDVVRCTNAGGSGSEVDWTCKAELPESLRLGRVEVGCEGFSKPGDEYVLKGSFRCRPSVSLESADRGHRLVLAQLSPRPASEIWRGLVVPAYEELVGW
jgi:hypothetical protein